MVWCNHILDKALAFNTFNEPLQHNEVKGIAKSVANWVWREMRYDTDTFRQRQSERGHKGGTISGKSRLSKANNRRVAAQALKDEGMALSEIARTLDVSPSTITKWNLE